MDTSPPASGEASTIGHRVQTAAGQGSAHTVGCLTEWLPRDSSRDGFGCHLMSAAIGKEDLWFQMGM
jgi:hypothetical protein